MILSTILLILAIAPLAFLLVYAIYDFVAGPMPTANEIRNAKRVRDGALTKKLDGGVVVVTSPTQAIIDSE